MASNTDRCTSCRPAATEVSTTSEAATAAAVQVTSTTRATVRHRRSCPRPSAAAEAADRSDCRAAVSTCPARPATGWLPPRLSLRLVAGATETTPASRTSRRDTEPGSRRRNSTSWNGASARPTIRTFSCARKSPCGSASPSPEYR